MRRGRNTAATFACGVAIGISVAACGRTHFARPNAKDLAGSGAAAGSMSAGRSAAGSSGDSAGMAPAAADGASGHSGGATATDDPANGCDRRKERIDKIDLLLSIDDSNSMDAEQESLTAQFPRLIRVLTSGDLDGDGLQDFQPVSSLHLGVVSSDLGAIGVPDIDKCEWFGDDGALQHESAVQPGCHASYPPFISYVAGASHPEETARDLGCIAMLGTGGCGFEQQLESVLKALWPSTDERVPFVPDPTGMAPALGKGDTLNAGFLRPNFDGERSMLVVLMLSDEDDCSLSDTRILTPEHQLPPDDPLAAQPLNLRCFYNKDALFPVVRYTAALRQLRTGNPDLVMFTAIAGIPLEAAREATLVDFTDPSARDHYYTRLLGHPAMQERLDPDRPEFLVPVCGDTSKTMVYPARRIVETARVFGSNGAVQSICGDDLGPAVDAILARIAQQLDPPCP